MRINHISTFLICAWTKLFLFNFLYERKYRKKDEKNCIVRRFAYMHFYIEIQTTSQNSKMSFSSISFIQSKKLECIMKKLEIQLRIKKN